MDLDPKVAQDAFSQLPLGTEEQLRLLGHLATRLAEKSPEEASRWVARFSTEEEKSAAYAAIAVVMAETDPRKAAALISDKGIEGRETNVAIVKVVQRWTSEAEEEEARMRQQEDGE